MGGIPDTSETKYKLLSTRESEVMLFKRIKLNTEIENLQEEGRFEEVKKLKEKLKVLEKQIKEKIAKLK